MPDSAIPSPENMSRAIPPVLRCERPLIFGDENAAILPPELEDYDINAHFRGQRICLEVEVAAFYEGGYGFTRAWIKL